MHYMYTLIHCTCAVVYWIVLIYLCFCESSLTYPYNVECTFKSSIFTVAYTTLKYSHVFFCMRDIHIRVHVHVHVVMNLSACVCVC